MTQNKRNERKKTKDFPRGWTVCAYPCLHPVPSHQQCVTSISRNRENLSWSRRKIDSVLEYLFTFASRAYVIVWFKFLCSSGIPPYYQLFLSWTEEKFWHSVGKWPAFHRIDVKPRAVKCSCSTLILWSV